MSSLPHLRKRIYLIGDVVTEISGNKLPSKSQVLKLLFYHLRHLNLTVADSKRLVVNEVALFWDKAGIPIQKKHRCCEKLDKLYRKWRNIQKCANKPSNIDREKQFIAELNDLFDIAHGNADKLIDEDKRMFLSRQRETGRKGYIGDF